MKRKRLLFAAIALIAGALNINAQEDITSQYLTNANLSTQNAGWTYGGYTAWVTDGAVPVVEFWNWSNQFSFSQTITLPAGDYRLAVNSFYRESWGGNGTNNNMAWIYAGDKTQNVVALNNMGELSGYSGSNDLYRAATAFSQGKYSNEFDFTIDTDDTQIEIGFKGTTPNGGWCILGPVKLLKYSLEAYLVDYRAKVAEAEALYDSPMSSTALAALQAAVVNETTLQTVAQVTDAIQTLTAAINAAQASILIYGSVDIDGYRAKMAEVLDNTNVYTTEAYNKWYGNVQEIYETGGYTDDELATLTANGAWNTGWQSANRLDEVLLSSWTIDGEQPKDYTKALYINTWSTEGDNDGSEFHAPFFEYFAADGSSLKATTLVSTVTGLKANTTYSFAIWARVRQNNGQTKIEDAITLQVGDGTPVDISAGAHISGDRFYLGSFAASGTTDANGTLTATITVAENSNIHWFSFQNCMVTEGEDLSIYVQNLATAVANAEALYDKIPAAIKANLETVVTANNKTYTTAADYITAINTINAAAEDAEAWVEPYAAFNLAKTDVQALYDVAEYEELVEGAHDALGDALAAGDEAETIDALNAATENLKAAAYTYVCNANPTGDAKFDLTFMLTNPDLTNLPSWNKADGWYTDQTFPTQNNQVMDTDGQHYYEYWSNNSNPVSGYTVYLKITLPEGAYQMTAKAKAGWGGGASNPNGRQNITFSAGDIDGTSITSSGALEDADIEFINNAEQEVKIGLKAHEGNTCNWMGIGYVNLFKVAPKAFVINESEDYDYTQSGAGDVKLTRTIKEGMNSVVLPFQLTAEDIVTLGGEGAVAYTVTDYANDNLKLAEAETTLPNVPFFLKVVNLQNTNLFEFTDKTIVAGQPSVTVGDATLVGTYAKIDAVPEGSYILSGGKFYKVNSTVSLKPTRAYITIAEPTEVSALGFTIEDATAIVGVESETVNGEVYDIAGRKVSSPVRGLYIANGKKVLVK